MQKFVDHKSNYLQNMFDIKMHFFDFYKEICTESHEVWLFVSKVCIKEDIPREWRVGKSKKTYNLQNSIKLRNSVGCQRHLV